jgi:hypothetical protein
MSRVSRPAVDLLDRPKRRLSWVCRQLGYWTWNSRLRALALLAGRRIEPGLGQIELAFDASQDFVVDSPLVT